MKSLRPLVILLIFFCLSIGCTVTQNQGKLVRTGEVTQLVESGTVLPEHTYYYTGPQAEPDAIIAIDNRFTLQAKYWIKVDDVAAQLKDWNRYIDNAHRVPNEQEGPRSLDPFYRGARIMAPDGSQAGIWYSRHDHTVIQFPDPSTIILYAPVTPVERERPFPRRF